MHSGNANAADELSRVPTSSHGTLRTRFPFFGDNPSCQRAGEPFATLVAGVDPFAPVAAPGGLKTQTIGPSSEAIL